MNFKFGSPRLQKDTEATTGPKLLVTVKGNKLIPSPTVIKTLGLNSDWEGEGQNSKATKEGNRFNIGYITRDEKEVPVLYVDENGYLIGKNGGVSAPAPVSALLANLDLQRETYEVEGDGNPRSFNMRVNVLKPITLYATEDGEVSETETDGATAFNVYEMSFLGNVIKGVNDEEGEEEEGDASVEDDTENVGKRRGKKAQA